MGLQKGKEAEVRLTGYNLSPAPMVVKGQPSQQDERSVILRPETPSGRAFNEIALALGEAPEVLSSGENVSLDTAQPVTLPVTVNGRVEAAENTFRFRAKKGEKIVLTVNARRLGSRLDSVLEVVDVKGNPIERGVVRCMLETSTTLRDHDSVQAGIRIQSPTGFAVDDYVMIGSEILQVDAMPRTPDDDFRFVSFGGRRVAYFDTTPEAHANDSPVYKVQIHPPGAQFASNGLPLVRLYHRNDDGGPGYGKDSRLRFVAPADGEYIARLRDVRGFKGGLNGDDLRYRLAIRQPQPDFQLSVNPRNPNVPVGGRIPIAVTALRMDEFEGPIEITVEDLPAGLEATKGVIGPGQISTTLLLTAREDAKLERAVPLTVMGRAKAGSRQLVHAASLDDKLKLISLMPKPDIFMNAGMKEVELTPGGTVEVQVAIERNNGFGGRVPVEVLNLPPGVRVLDVGLNGVLINEDEQQRSFVLEALPTAPPIEQPIVVAGRVETRAGGQQTSFAGLPIKLKVKPKVELAAGSKPSPAERPSATK
ncbi:MAG: hypothetical protein WD696_04205 [Bryobacteraceae bacterium]